MKTAIYIFFGIVIYFLAGAFILPVITSNNDFKLYLDSISQSFPQTNEVFIFTAVMTLIPYLIWFKYGRDPLITPIVNFNPPENQNSAEFEVDFAGYSSPRGIVSLIYYLANKGYLEIDVQGNNYILRKLKPYDGKNEIEKKFFEGIFSLGNGETVNINKISNSDALFMMCAFLQGDVNKAKKYIYKNDSTLFKKVIIILLCSLGIALSILYTLGNYTFQVIFFSSSLMFFIFPYAAILSAVAVFANFEQTANSFQMETDDEQLKKSLYKHRKLCTVIFMFIWVSGFGGIPAFYMLLGQENLLNHPFMLVFELICLIVCMTCMVNMKTLNNKGRQLRGQALGLKKYLEVAEKKRIEDLSEINPNYCADLFPYAYAIGVAESWMMNMDGVVSAASPSWFKGDFNIKNLKNINNLLSKNSQDS